MIAAQLLTHTQYAAHLTLVRHDVRAEHHVKALMDAIEAVRPRLTRELLDWDMIVLDGACERARAFLEEET